MKTASCPIRFGLAVVMTAGLLFCIASSTNTLAYPRYNGSNGGCSDCHGTFTGTNSPKGTIFPSASKHEMHRASTSMNTACALCHTTGDNRNPFIGSSDGTTHNQGLGCSGCHVAAGLRLHHEANGITVCGDCHNPETSVPENVKPPYYGTVDTKVDNPENLVLAANTNENWSVGDFIGLDNDGNNLYDAADYACNPYKILSAAKEGNNFRVTWRTAGGRADLIQASLQTGGTFSNVSSVITIPGVGVVTTNYLVAGGATNASRFYRVKSSP